MAKQASAESRPLFHPDEIVESIEAFWSWGERGDVFVKLGARMRADEDVVRRHPEKFVRDGSTDAEKQRAREAAHPFREPEQHRPIITQPEPLTDQNAVLCIQNVRANSDGDVHLARPLALAVGMKLPKDDPFVLAFPDHFVPIVAPGLTPQTAVRARGDRYETRKDEGGRFILEDDGTLRSRYGEHKRFLVHYAGQWVSRDNPYVTAHPELYEAITDV